MYMDVFFIVWVDGTDGGFHAKHQSRKDAKNEAERLAQLPANKGKEVYVMELDSCCVAPPYVTWKIISPF